METKKKKILHLIQSLDNGGCENMLLRTLPRLTAFDHTILTLQTPGSLAANFQQQNITIENVGLKHLFDIRGLRNLSQKITSYHPDIIVTYLLHADILGRLVVPFFTSVPVLPFLRTTYNHPRYRLARIFEYLTKSRVTHYLANSEAVKSFYTEKLGVKPEKITVIPNGVDIEYFENTQPNEKVRETLGIAPDHTVIICVANLHTNKGHRYLLDAFEAVYKEYPHTQLLIVGSGEEKANICHQMEAFKSKKNIHLLGQRVDIPSLLSVSDIFVLPTLFEGMSNALLEALASGVAVITTDIPENRQIITSEKNGLLVPTKNPLLLQKALNLLLSNISLRREIATAGSQTVFNEYSIEAAVQKLDKVLQKNI